MKREHVLRSLIGVGTYQEFISEIATLAESKIPSYVCFANVHMVVEGYKDRAFQQIINQASVVTPDGKPISLFLNYFANARQERVCGMDLFPDLLKQAEASGQSVYFYGTTDQVLSNLVQKARFDFPLLKISGYYSPPFRDISDEENDDIIEEIMATSPDLVFVSLGCPKQEKWMAKNSGKMRACLLGVGQAFNTYAGVEKRLPIWMRNLSLEWMYRLYLEPQRLWKRYLFTNSYFLWLTFKFMMARWGTTSNRAYVKVKPVENVLQEIEE